MPKRKRAIPDAEIALIRAMVLQGISKTKIQAYFTRPDRPLNFGRITNIGDGQYGRYVPAATQEEVDRFLAEAAHGQLDLKSLPATDRRRVMMLFSKRDQRWCLDAGETDEVECKLGFSLGGRILRAIAALANNRGGYLFLGVHDETGHIEGLSTDRIARIDPSKISQAVRSAMEPAPRIEVASLDVDGRQLGVLYVHRELDGPVIATKTDHEFREGTIYYRYHGESRPIGGAEFRKLLGDRDRRLRESTGAEIARLLELGPRGAVVDVASNVPGVARIVREGIDEADVLRNFIRSEQVEIPLAYLLRSCTTSRSWLPVFYYMQMANLTLADAIGIVEDKETSHVARKRDLLARLRGARSAYAKPSGRVAILQKQVLAGDFEGPSSARDAGDLALAIIGLKEAQLELSHLLHLLRLATDAIRSTPNAKADTWSYIYKAAARVDELYFRPATTPA